MHAAREPRVGHPALLSFSYRHHSTGDSRSNVKICRYVTQKTLKPWRFTSRTALKRLIKMLPRWCFVSENSVTGNNLPVNKLLSASNCGQYPVFCCTSRILFKMLWPQMKASPAVGVVSPVSILNVVVFPAPFTPNNPKHSPLGTPTFILDSIRLILGSSHQYHSQIQ